MTGCFHLFDLMFDFIYLFFCVYKSDVGLYTSLSPPTLSPPKEKVREDLEYINHVTFGTILYMQLYSLFLVKGEGVVNKRKWYALLL